ncbi:glycoside hydrolase family 65 protein [Phycicoccus flavus]|uniref:glycoside hydrolase family 65 protein n=1 Tax=Phycicoccus flavus TaxID=2502783 RepID=UPI000FEBD46E|nr:glycosyl hydrolase family 65 protein [Phycicoccus flavus]NHA68020.1 glycoside hydrolase family 65 protein [Phycicoccus flavus]
MRTDRVGADPLDRTRLPADPWRLVERAPDPTDLGLTETLFAVANGYIGLRANPEEGREAHEHGTFVNGFHETWPIRHAEGAYGFARTGQTIVNVPDAKLMKLYVDDEPLVIGQADLEHYERSLDFRDGILRRSLLWRTPSGKRVRVDSTRMVSMTERHLVVLTLEVTMLGGDAPVVVSSQLLNRQDGEDEYHAPAQTKVTMADPRKAGSFEGRVLLPVLHAADESRMTLGFRCANSGMTVAAMADHVVSTTDPYETVTRAEDDLAKTVYRVEAREGHTLRIEKLVAYHTSRSLPVRELADRCERTLDRTGAHAVEDLHAQQREWYDRFWAASDVEVDTAGPEDAALQQAIRYNLLALAQASGRADQQGVPAKGVTGSGYEGHYFWDSEVYVAPFLTYTQPSLARNLMHFRSRMLPAARDRAREMSQRGALFPWRTINGEEASAYYAAGTAQVHIDADVAHALGQYLAATDDVGFLVRDGLAVLVETARMYTDLGFWRSNGTPSFHIHGVTGPDEYTTVVNNNLFTNVMARGNLEQAARAVERVRAERPQEYARVAADLGISDDEVAEWRACAAGMHIPFDDGLGIHPQDDLFLDREVWDLSRTPASVRPLLLHYHPLVIYRFQVLKQADVVLALFLQGDRFTMEQKRADFEYYDPITTGDSTLSAVVQSVVAAEVGYHETALDYFYRALYVDLADLHENTVDGLHVASAGGVWAALVSGFGGMRDHGGVLRFDPRLPQGWRSLVFRLTWRGTRVRVRLTEREVELVAEAGEEAVPVEIRGSRHTVTPEAPVVVPLDGHGLRIDGLLGPRPKTGGIRADGTRITAGVPDPIPFEELEQQPDGVVSEARG